MVKECLLWSLSVFVLFETIQAAFLIANQPSDGLFALACLIDLLGALFFARFVIWRLKSYGFIRTD